MFSNNIPGDPIILLSFINTKLRDEFSSLDDLCSFFDIDKESIISSLDSINYTYDAIQNQFI